MSATVVCSIVVRLTNLADSDVMLVLYVVVIVLAPVLVVVGIMIVVAVLFVGLQVEW